MSRQRSIRRQCRAGKCRREWDTPRRLRMPPQSPNKSRSTKRRSQTIRQRNFAWSPDTILLLENTLPDPRLQPDSPPRHW